MFWKNDKQIKKKKVIFTIITLLFYYPDQKYVSQ